MKTENKEPVVINGYPIAGRMPQFKKELREANRDGHKRMTRRVMTYRNSLVDGYCCPKRVWGELEFETAWIDKGLSPARNAGRYAKVKDPVTDTVRHIYPRMQVGDIRVMCEPLKRIESGLDNKDWAEYADDNESVFSFSNAFNPLWWRWEKDYLASIHMPYEAGRSLFKINEIRAERLQDIRSKDAALEGVRIPLKDGVPLLDVSSKYAACNYISGETSAAFAYGKGTAACGQDLLLAYFASLWDSINAEPKRRNHNPYTQQPEKCYVSYPWEDIRETREHRGLKWYVIGNPMVWVYGYKAMK